MNKKRWALFIIFFFLAAFASPVDNKEFTLSEIIDLGLENSPLLRAMTRGVEAKKAAYQASKRLLNPKLEFHRGKAKSHDSSIERNTDGIALSQHIENPFKRHYRIKVYEQAWQAAENSFSFSRLEVIHDIKNLFYKILLLKNREELTQKNLEALKEIHQLIEKRVKLGETKELESIKLYVETLKGQNELNKVLTEQKLAKENLNKYLGNILPSDFSVSGKLEYSSLTYEAKSLLNQALLYHPLIKGKERELEQAESTLNYTKWQRLPDFKLSGFIEDELDGKNKGIGFSLDIPLWNFKSKEIAEAESLFQKQWEELEYLKMEISTEVKTKLSELRLSEQTIKLFLEGLLRQAEASLNISEVSYKQGEISLIDYLDSQRTYYSILKDYQDSLYAWSTNKAALEKATGEEIK